MEPRSEWSIFFGPASLIWQAGHVEYALCNDALYASLNDGDGAATRSTGDGDAVII